MQILDNLQILHKPRQLLPRYHRPSGADLACRRPCLHVIMKPIDLLPAALLHRLAPLLTRWAEWPNRAFYLRQAIDRSFERRELIEAYK